MASQRTVRSSGGVPERIGTILAALRDAELPEFIPRAPHTDPRPASAPPPREAARKRPRGAPIAREGECVFDLDLAEFPLFRFSASARHRRSLEPLTYSDTITARDGSRVRREWTAVPGPAGVGGPSTQLLLFDLIQMYAEQEGGRETIRYGTMRSILTRRGLEHPCCRDYARLRRDLEILRGYEIRCSNACWDSEAGRYGDRTWRLLPETAKFAQGRAGSSGGIDAGEELRRIVSTRGFFPLGFGRDAFYRLRPLEQRLAIYLARKFRFQSLHRRHVEDLARALPIEASRPRDVRACLARTTRGLLASDVHVLRNFRFACPRSGRWIAEFHRAVDAISVAPRRDDPRDAFDRDDRQFEFHLTRIAQATGSSRDRAWWLRCLRRLGPGPMDRALGQLREACVFGRVRNRGGLLTKILKDIAEEAGIELS